MATKAMVAAVVAGMAGPLLPVPARAQDAACEALYLARNGIYRDAGYCFKTGRAIRRFGNAGCRFDDVAEVPLSNAERQRAASLAARERQLGCAP